MKDVLRVYHTGHLIIDKPDVHYGRVNADFGQGFYTTADSEFSARWAKLRRDEKTVVNEYKLNLEGLCIHRFQRDMEWFRYIFNNRRGRQDELDADIIIGPIANDTIYDTLGIFTSGLMSDELALDLLSEGPQYEQIALKTQRAADQLTWVSSHELSEEQIIENHDILLREQDEFLTLIGKKVEDEE